jgi:translation initiation factor 2B subunit (eIF-2B alpha/beta/delta family)
MFEKIAGDSTSGASRLTRLAAEELSTVVAGLEGMDPGATWDGLVAACRELLAAKREMAPIVNLVGSALAAAENVILSGKSPETAVRAVQLECSRVSEFGEERLSELGERGAPLVEDGATVATTSDGESVRAVFEAAARAGTSFQVLLSESRPALEGLSLARRISELDVRSTVVTDAALPGMVSGSDLVLLGADSVSDESFVNKTGSYALALAAREAGIPCYVVATTDKLLPTALRGDVTRDRDPGEVLGDPPPMVAVRNPYFEIVPLGICRGLVTEVGVADVSEVASMLAERPVPPFLLQLLFAPAPPRGV